MNYWWRRWWCFWVIIFFSCCCCCCCCCCWGRCVSRNYLLYLATCLLAWILQIISLEARKLIIIIARNQWEEEDELVAFGKAGMASLTSKLGGQVVKTPKDKSCKLPLMEWTRDEDGDGERSVFENKILASAYCVSSSSGTSFVP